VSRVVPKHRITLEKLREEANAMERLAHKHILKLVGTYTLKNKNLYLLLYPVAVCDLSKFLEDIDDLRTGNCADRDDALKRLGLLGVKNVGTIEELAAGRVPVHRITASSSSMTAVGFLQQILGCMTEALAYVHSKDIRHCDLKPKNILLSPGRVYLADFGIARDVREAEDSVTDSRCGSPFWMAPEVDNEIKHHKTEADIWALGCIFLNIATILYGEALEKYEHIMKDHDWNTKYEKLPGFLDYLRSKAKAAQFEDHDAPSFNFKHIINLIESMLRYDPDERPKALEVNARLTELGGLDQIYHLSCCHKDNAYVSSVLSKFFQQIRH
jgi:serine/threonine protein kinase